MSLMGPRLSISTRLVLSKSASCFSLVVPVFLVRKSDYYSSTSSECCASVCTFARAGSRDKQKEPPNDKGKRRSSQSRLGRILPSTNNHDCELEATVLITVADSTVVMEHVFHAANNITSPLQSR